jgi:hypothetical protein
MITSFLPKSALSRVYLAGLLACAGLAAPAYAQTTPPGVANNATARDIVDQANSAGRVLYVSGASAVFAGFGQIAATLFQGTPFRFAPTGAPASTDYVAFAGRLAQDTGTWRAGDAAIIINRARGGSVWGVNPVARNEAIESLNVTTAACPAGLGTTTAPFECSLNTRVPDAGISDLAPALFVGAINNPGEIPAAPLSPSELLLLEALPIYTLGFGVPVTNNVPDLRLNRAVLAGIMSGEIGTWGQVATGLPTDIAAADMLVCRRTPGSGTQAIANLYFGNHPCTVTTNPPANRADTPAWNLANRTFTVEGNTGGVNVVELSTSGQVRSCLNEAVIASNRPFVASPTPATLNTVTGAVTPGIGYTHFTTADRSGRTTLVQFRNGRTHAAVGLLSLDSVNDSVAGIRRDAQNVITGGWSFRSLDGAGRMFWTNATTPPTTTGSGRHATIDNLVDGTWDKVGVISFNVPTRTTGNVRALADSFVAAARDPEVLRSQESLRFAAVAVRGTPDPNATGQVQRVEFRLNDQCGPLNLVP